MGSVTIWDNDPKKDLKGFLVPGEKKPESVAATKFEAASALVPETEAIRREIDSFLNTTGKDGKKIGDSKWGVYVFYDYYGEPIYVGQTQERLRVRVRRHLTNQRTDAVAMSVLDPVEVAEIEVWPFAFEPDAGRESITQTINRAEYAVYKRVLDSSKLKAVLNEKDIFPSEVVPLPDSYRARIVPEPFYTSRKHPDIRIAQRASKIADLAKIIIERKVSKGLRRVLHLQAIRLESLAKERLNEVVETPPEEGEEGNENES